LQQEYTHAKFAEVQAEFHAKMNCFVLKMVVDGSGAAYDGLEEMNVCSHQKDRIFKISICVDESNMKCNYFLIEFKGIICRHLLVVLAINRVKDVPAKYVMSRWSKNMKRNYMYIKCSMMSSNCSPKRRGIIDYANIFTKLQRLYVSP